MTTTPTIAALATSLFITAFIGFALIPFLRKLKYGQTILDIGPKWHSAKQGTPTMGGIMFIIGITLGVGMGYALLFWQGVAITTIENMRVLLGMVMALAFGGIGFIDDYIKVVKRQNLGLTAGQKLILQFGIAILYLWGLRFAGDISTYVLIPFFGHLNLGLAYMPLAAVGIVYLVNVVNITDGIDGLCGSVTFISALGFLGIAAVLGRSGMSVMSAALAAGCLGFLLWNFYPAKVFMGDTGSLFLGGMVVALGFGLGIPVYLAFIGILYIVEGLSVVIQTIYFKYTRRKTGTGKRLFKMSPIHHHFEMSGWSEARIVVTFSLFQLLGCIAAITAIYLV